MKRWIGSWWMFFLLLLTSVLIAATAYYYLYVRKVPSLSEPLSVVEGYAMADGGSLVVVLEGASGLKLLVGLRGSLDTPQNSFPLYFQRSYPTNPIPVVVQMGSKKEKRLVELLRMATSESNGEKGGNAESVAREIIRIAESR